jgi:hypothetical protein
MPWSNPEFDDRQQSTQGTILVQIGSLKKTLLLPIPLLLVFVSNNFVSKNWFNQF